MPSIAPTASSRTLLLIDGDKPCHRPDALVVRWSSVEVAPGEQALPSIVERRARELRDEYITWIAVIAQAPTPRGTLAQALRLAAMGGISFWPLTLIAEKAPLKSPTIYRTFKLRALERIYLDNACRGIEYDGADLGVHAVLREWCLAMGHPYRRIAAGRGHTRADPLWYRRLPGWVQSLLYLMWLWWARRRASKSGRSRSVLTRDVLVVTYFPNIDTERAAKGEFRSRYWEKFHELLEDQGFRVDWVWIYVPSEQYSYGASLRLRDDFDKTAQGRQHHYMLQEFLTLGSALRAMLGFAELHLKGLIISRAVRRAFSFPGSAMNLFPVFADEWRSCIFGKLAIEALLYLEMFRELTRNSQSSCVFYVWENQGWERALVTAFRESSVARTIGFQHATLPPLDLRAFPAGSDEVIPDTLAVNGAGAKNEMLRAGFPPERLRTASAFRYLHFSGLRNSQKRELPRQDRTLMVVGGYLNAETRQQLHLLCGSQSVLSRFYRRCLVKPHPFSVVNFAEELATLPIPVEVSTRPLAELWNEVDVTYCANSTSAAMEAAWFGLPVILASAGDDMNVSPFFGWPGLEFAVDTAALAGQLENPARIELPADYFCLDDELKSWHEILGDCRRLNHIGTHSA